MGSRVRLRAPLGVIVSQLATGCGAHTVAPPLDGVVSIPEPARASSPAPPTITAAASSASPSARVVSADADGDGVPDQDDKCPTEPQSASATAPRDGCPQRVVIAHTNPPPPVAVQFAGGSASIQSSAARLLDEVAATMQSHPEVLLVEVEGHTDTSGSSRAEVAISQRRAEAVAAAIVARGVDAGRVRAKGYGAYCPIAPNDRPANREKNRRARFVVVKTATGATGASPGCAPATAAGVTPEPVP
jgi:OmpA-OmpF porin, OOP family